MIEERRVPGQKYGPPTMVDLDSLCPVEAFTIYADIHQAERYYLQNETTKNLIKVVQAGRLLNPIDVAPFNARNYPFRSPKQKEMLEPYLDRWKFSIEDGNHRYFAYKACGVKQVPVEVMSLKPVMESSVIRFKEILMKKSEEIWLDHYSNTLKKDGDGFTYVGSFARLINRVNDGNLDAAIITAYRHECSLSQNIVRNRILRTTLNSSKMGAYQLVGHFQEYDEDVKANVDVIERSYFIVRPDTMSFEAFVEILKGLMTIDGKTQESIIVKRHGTWFIMNTMGEFSSIGTNVTLGKIAQAYSQSVLKVNTPFVIEGMEVPQSGRVAMYLFNKNNVLYISPFHGQPKHLGI